MNELIFNGKRLSEFGAFYDSHQAFNTPERDLEYVEILGRDGDLIIDNDRFKNIEINFPCYIPTDFLPKYRNLMVYLNSQRGYKRLEYSQEPDHYRMASFAGNVEASPLQLHRAGRFTLPFICKPQRFLKSGEIPVSASSQSVSYTGNPVEIDNPSGISAVSSLAVALNPIQNLNGYDSPWVGGSGKNLLPSSTAQTSNGVKFTVNDDGTITATRTASSTNNAEYDLTVPSSLYGKAVILNGCPSGGSDSGTYRMFFLVNGSRQATDYGNGVTYTIPSSPTSCVVRINVFKDFNSTATFKPMIRLASVSDATYEPYSNICPIYASNGKNLLQITATSQTVNGVTFTVNADGTVKANGTASSAAEFVIKSDVSGNAYAGMILSGCPNGGSASTYRLFEQVQGSPWTYLASDGGSGVTIPTTTYTTVRFVIRVESGVSVNNLVFKPMIRPASITDSTYVPYQSIMVTRTGKNLFNGQFAYHNVDKYSPVLDGETYTVSSKSTGAHQINMQYITKTNTYYGERKIVSEGDTFGKTTVTIPTDVKGVLIYVNGDASNSQHTAYDTQIELGSTATEYEPYQGNTYTINLNGTRYGGTLDVLTGKLTVDRVSVDMGSLTWTYESGTNCMITPALSGLKLPTSDNVAVDAITAVAKIIPASQRVAVSGVRAYVFTGNRQMLFRDTGYTDPSAFKTAMNGNNIVYALATPQTVQLTPQQISLLTGINYISSSDEVTVTVSEPSLLENPTLFESKPLIRVYGHGTLIVNNQYVTIAENPYEYIDIDCDIMDAFYGANNANQYVTLPNDYITLKSGNNYIAYDGTVQITPRWYEV